MTTTPTSSQILLIDYREHILKTLKMDLLRYFDLTALVRPTAKESLSLLELLPDVMLGLVLASNPKEQTALDLAAFIKQHRPGFQLVVYQEQDSTEAIIRQLGSTLQKNIDPSLYQKDHAQDGFSPIAISLLECLDESPSDLFLRLGSQDTGYKWIKKINKMDPLAKTMLSELQQKNIRELYVEKEFLGVFTTSLSNRQINNLLAAATPEALLDAQIQSFQFVHSYVVELHFEQKVVDVVDSTVESMLKLVQKEGSIAKLIGQVMQKRSGEAFQSFYLSSLLCFHCLKHLGRFQESKWQHMIQALLFCDLEIDAKETFFIKSQLEWQQAQQQQKITPAQAELVRQHAQKNALLLNEYKEVPLEVLGLIRQHHGHGEGLGFSDDETSILSDDAIILMMTNTFIKYFIDAQYKFDKKEILRQMKERFHGPRMLAAIEALSAKIQ